MLPPASRSTHAPGGTRQAEGSDCILRGRRSGCEGGQRSAIRSGLARRGVFRLYLSMDPATLVAILKPYAAALRANGATGLYIFGSRARGEHRPDSDLDLFIDYDPASKVPDISHLMQLEEELGKRLGVSVTITTRNALHPLMKEQIERDVIRVL
jgi:predicted nucleotidyltransferase